MSRRPVQVRTAEKMAQHADMPDPLRVSTILERPQPELLADLQRRFEGRLTMQTIFVPAYGLTVLEAFSHGTSKHAAVTYVAQGLRIGKGQIASVGDDMNDLSMIQGAGLRGHARFPDGGAGGGQAGPQGGFGSICDGPAGRQARWGYPAVLRSWNRSHAVHVRPCHWSWKTFPMSFPLRK